MPRVSIPRLLRGRGRKQSVIIGVIAVQVLIPAIALVGTPPTRLGFQMYSAQGYVHVFATDKNGEEINVDPRGFLASAPRPELNWVHILPERVCAATPQAVRVSVKQPEHERTVLCN